MPNVDITLNILNSPTPFPAATELHIKANGRFEAIQHIKTFQITSDMSAAELQSGCL
jgi:hypothetical protein